MAWVGATGNKSVEIVWDNGRNTGYSAVCQATDSCTGKYYPKRAELTIPADSYPSNYTVSESAVFMVFSFSWTKLTDFISLHMSEDGMDRTRN